MTWGLVAGAAIGVGGSLLAGSQANKAAGQTADASLQAAELQLQAGRDASALLDPFAVVGQQGLDQAGFLTDPNAQFEFLQNNPLFQQILEQNQQQAGVAQGDLFKMAAARGRLSSGDTLQQINQLGENSARNLLLSASPLISNQKQSIGDLLNFGMSTAGGQGNLLIGQGAAGAGGIIGAQNALNQGTQSNINSIEGISALLSGATTGLLNRPQAPVMNTPRGGR